MSGQARWVFEGDELHARLLAAGWEQTSLRREIFGSGAAVILVIVTDDAQVVSWTGSQMEGLS